MSDVSNVSSVNTVQGTVATFEPGDGSGVVLLDDGTPVPFPGTAFVASGLRLLRAGQRVRIVRDGAGTVSGISLITMSGTT